MPLKIGLKSAFLSPIFSLFFALKPQYIVVEVCFSPSEPHFVIRTILSTCLEEIKKMPVKPVIPLASGYISEKIACEHRFFQAPLSACCKFSVPVCIVFLAIRYLLFTLQSNKVVSNKTFRNEFILKALFNTNRIRKNKQGTLRDLT